MGNRYWTSRKNAAMVMARDAVTSDVRLIHYELAGRYSIHAAQSIVDGPIRQDGRTGQGAILRMRAPALGQPVLPPLANAEERLDPEA